TIPAIHPARVMTYPRPGHHHRSRCGGDLRPRPPLRLARAPEGRTWLSISRSGMYGAAWVVADAARQGRADQPPCRASLSSFSPSSLREDLRMVPPYWLSASTALSGGTLST